MNLYLVVPLIAAVLLASVWALFWLTRSEPPDEITTLAMLRDLKRRQKAERP